MLSISWRILKVVRQRQEKVTSPPTVSEHLLQANQLLPLINNTQHVDTYGRQKATCIIKPIGVRIKGTVAPD